MRPACNTGTRKYVNMKVISTLRNTVNGKKVPCYTSIFKTSIVHNLICKVNNSIVARRHGGAHAAVGYTTVLEVALGAFISEILQTAPKVKGYPHLPASFQRRLQVHI